ncbi:ribosomal RNA-processing protein 8, putative [Hepatocystis sp. ex Piliocolobus tephrosceles]|nr:ribosomal RNA-processing protein 8, putative [Hepatocystis sp. ex Piliocolobus tephrosceles]
MGKKKKVINKKIIAKNKHINKKKYIVNKKVINKKNDNIKEINSNKKVNVHKKKNNVSDGKVSDGNVSDGNISDGNISDGNISDGNISDGNISDGNISDGNISDGNISDGNISNGNISDGNPGGENPSGENANDNSYFTNNVVPSFENSELGNKKQQYKKKNKKMASSPENIVNSYLFRHINEYMYTNKSEIVQKKLNETKNMFHIYHLGYQNQKKKWPNNPINIIITYLKKKFTKQNKIADLGCGEAEIAQTLTGWKITSFDLIQYNEHVTVCNIIKLPIKDKSYDCFILCLSLMNTDWPKIIYEAARCLKQGGTLIITEVVSRFTNYKIFIKFMTNTGFTLMDKINLNNFFYVLIFEKQDEKSSIFSLKQKKIEIVSKLLAPCVYKKR